MSDKQQQILQMAKDICRVKLNCNDVCNPISACDALRYAERAVEAGYSKQSEWVSVEEALPTEWENVLVFEDGGISIAFIDIKSWWDYESYYKNDTWHQVFPTHWMPLPEPPKMKGGAE